MTYPAESKLNGAITAAATSLTLQSGAGFTFAPFHLVIESEIILCPTLPAGNVVSGVTRGAQGTNPAAHNDQTGAYGLFSAAFSKEAMGGLGGYWDQLAAQLGAVEGRLNTQGQTFALVNQTGSAGPVTVFTAPASGVYSISAQLHLIATNNVGTLTATITPPPSTPPFNNVPSISAGTDGTTRPLPMWLNAGQTVTLTLTATGLTGTTYSIYVTSVRNF
jgi:hypothetical protein